MEAIGHGRLPKPFDRGQVRDLVHRTVTTRAGLFDAVLLTGESGIGKSTLWAEGVTAARLAGLRVLTATAAEPEASMPYVVLDDLLSDVIDDALPELPEPQREALEIALLRTRPTQRPPSERLIASAVRSVLRWCAEQDTVLVAMDDLQWVDAATQEALAFAFRRLSEEPITLFLSMRAAGPFDTWTEQAETSSALLTVVSPERRLSLPALPVAEVHALLEEQAGRPVSATDAELIVAATRGNLFWALEFGAALMDETSRPPGGRLPVPASLQALVNRRVLAQEPAVIDALWVVSAFGKPTVQAALGALEAMVDDPVQALDAAVAGGVVSRGGGRLVAAHPLFATAVNEAIPPGRQLKLHQRLAEVATSPELKAHHLALSVGDEEQPEVREEVAVALDAAVASAGARGATARAAELAEMAVRFSEPGHPETGRRRVTAARFAADLANFGRAIELLDPVDFTTLDTRLLAAALPLLAGAEYLLKGEAAARAKLTRAVDDDEHDPARLALLQARLADRYYGDHPRREEHARRAVDYAGQAGPHGIAMHQAFLEMVDVQVDRGDGVNTELLARVERLESAGVSPRIPYNAELHRVRGLMFTDQLATAENVLQRGLERARPIQDELATSLLSMYLTHVLLLSGRVAAASAALAESDEITNWNVGEPTGRTSVRGRLLLAMGRTDEVVQLVDGLGWLSSDHQRRQLSANYLMGMVAARRGEHTRAVTLLRRVRESAEALGLRETGSRCRVDTDLGEQLVLAGDLEEAAIVAKMLLEAGDRGNRPTLRGIGKRILGLCAAASKDLDGADVLLGAAVAEHERSELRPELGQSLLEQGRVQWRRKKWRVARSRVERAVSIFSQAGFVAQRELALAELAKMNGDRSSPVLTAAERRVVQLVATGVSNKEAALSLHVGIRTVETHLAAAYRKLGVRSRIELVRRFPDGHDRRHPRTSP